MLEYFIIGTAMNGRVFGIHFFITPNACGRGTSFVVTAFLL
jgi:hypothetical protein